MKILRYGSIATVALLAAAIGFMSCANGGKLESIRVTPADPTIARGTHLQFSALAIFSNGTAIDWTTAAIWSSSDATAVTVGNALGTYGLATSLVTGTTTTGTFTITATDTANHISGTATLYITDPQSIAITPANPYMATGTAHQFKATATLLLSDLTNTTTQNLTSSPTLSWSVDNTTDNTTAAISSTGLLSAGTRTGTATIVAFDIYSSSTPTATTTLHVTDSLLSSITVTAILPDLSISSSVMTQQFKATGNYQNGTQEFTNSVIWRSSKTSIATIDNTGFATAVATGTTTITATDPITDKSGKLEITIQ